MPQVVEFAADESDMRTVRFLVDGPADTLFEGGRFVFEIVLPPDYPMNPPSIVCLTDSGRFETGHKICTSFSDYHPEASGGVWGGGDAAPRVPRSTVVLADPRSPPHRSSSPPRSVGPRRTPSVRSSLLSSPS